MRRVGRARLRAICLAALALPGLAGCGGDDTVPAQSQPVAAGQGNDGSLVSVAQAEQGARQWWADHEQALLKRDAAQLARLEAQPIALVTIELMRASAAVQRPIISAARNPAAVRVHVPAQQSWPVPVLAVFDVASDATPAAGTAHVAELLMKQNPGAEMVAVETASLDAPEPTFDTDAAGYVHMIAAADQKTALGSAAADLPSTYDKYIAGIAHGSPAPSPAPFAPGKHTSETAASDASYLRDVSTRSHGNISSADLDYTEFNVPIPVFALSGGGGLAMFVTQRSETLHPAPGQAFLQDAQRHNYGADLPPGQYQLLTRKSVVVLAVRMAAGGAPIEALGKGGGLYQEG